MSESTRLTVSVATLPVFFCPPADAPTKKPLKGRQEKKKACGRKPLNKKKKEDWQKCVDAGGTDSFEGSDFDQFRNDYVDFSGLNLDL